VRNADGSVGGPWPEMKQKMPYKQVPVLKVGDTVISQSSAIVSRTEE
jgi:glutathione S-transferase